jgi:TonB family protein
MPGQCWRKIRLPNRQRKFKRTRSFLLLSPRLAWKIARFPRSQFQNEIDLLIANKPSSVMRSGCFHHLNNSERMPLGRLFLTLAVLVLSLAAAGTASAAKRTPTGSHIPEVEHPFAIPPHLWRSLFAATTPSGKPLSASEIAPLVRREYWPAGTYTRTNWHLKIGVFLLNVRSDGTVSSVEILHSTGHKILDGNCVSAFSKWRFQANSVKEVRLPAYYTVSR